MWKHLAMTAAMVLLLPACSTGAASITEAEQNTAAVTLSERSISEVAQSEVTQSAEMILEHNTESQTESSSENSGTITAVVGEQSFTIVMNESEAANALIARLPFTVSMGELNGNEKYYYLDQGLPTAAESVGTIQAGDFMLYGSDCLVLFYEGFRTSYRYTRLGQIEDPVGLAEALGRGAIEVTFHQ